MGDLIVNRFFPIPLRVVQHWQKDGKSEEEIQEIRTAYVEDCLLRHKRVNHPVRKRPYFEYTGSEPERF